MVIANGGGHHTIGAVNHQAGEPAGTPVHGPGSRSAAAGQLLARENHAIDRLLARQPFIASGGDERREIALTFDDGPGPYTPKLLDQLARLHAPATFFEIGFMIHYFNTSLERELRMRMAIGDHTETHPMMARRARPGLMYHVINPPPAGAPFPGLYVPAEEFAAQMQALKAAGWHAVTLDQIDAYWTRGTPLGPGKPIVITFDNGYESQYTNALPVFKQLGWVGVENIQVSGLPPSQGGLTDAQVRGMIAAGWELDTQGISHADLITLNATQLRYQVSTARPDPAPPLRRAGAMVLLPLWALRLDRGRSDQEHREDHHDADQHHATGSPPHRARR